MIHERRQSLKPTLAVGHHDRGPLVPAKRGNDALRIVGDGGGCRQADDCDLGTHLMLQPADLGRHVVDTDPAHRCQPLADQPKDDQNTLAGQRAGQCLIDHEPFLADCRLVEEMPVHPSSMGKGEAFANRLRPSQAGTILRPRGYGPVAVAAQ